MFAILSLVWENFYITNFWTQIHTDKARRQDGYLIGSKDPGRRTSDVFNNRKRSCLIRERKSVYLHDLLNGSTITLEARPEVDAPIKRLTLLSSGIFSEPEGRGINTNNGWWGSENGLSIIVLFSIFNAKCKADLFII